MLKKNSKTQVPGMLHDQLSGMKTINEDDFYERDTRVGHSQLSKNFSNLENENIHNRSVNLEESVADPHRNP